MKTALLPALLLLAFAAWACNLPGGYAELGKPLDTIVSIGPKGHSTWMRGDEAGSEVLLLGKLDNEGVGQIVLVRIERNTEATLTAGTYTRTDGNHLEVLYENMYRYPFEPNTNPLNKSGTTLIEIDVAVDYSVEYISDTLVLSEESEVKEFTDLASLLSRLDPASEDDWIYYARFFNFCIITSQARVPGFGSGRMLQYLGKKVAFKGMISGEFTIAPTGVLKPLTHIEYKDFSDFSGVALNGVQSNIASTSGKGHMFNTVDFSFPTDPEDPTATVNGSVDYGTRSGDRAVQLENGSAAGGSYRVSIEGAPAIDIDYQQFNDMDFTELFVRAAADKKAP